MEEKILVFVYGTLLSGEINNYLLQESKLLGEDKIIGFSMHDLGAFPACINDSPDKIILGEVWEIDDNTFRELDRLECYPNFYNRVIVETKFGDSWMYTNRNANKYPAIESGNWKEYNNRRPL